MQNIIKQDTNFRWSVVSNSITNPMNFVDQTKAMDCFLLLTQRGEHAELLRTTYTKSTEIIASSSEFDFAEDKREINRPNPDTTAATHYWAADAH